MIYDIKDADWNNQYQLNKLTGEIIEHTYRYVSDGEKQKQIKAIILDSIYTMKKEEIHLWMCENSFIVKHAAGISNYIAKQVYFTDEIFAGNVTLILKSKTDGFSYYCPNNDCFLKSNKSKSNIQHMLSKGKCKCGTKLRHHYLDSKTNSDIGFQTVESIKELDLLIDKDEYLGNIPDIVYCGDNENEYNLIECKGRYHSSNVDKSPFRQVFNYAVILKKIFTRINAKLKKVDVVFFLNPENNKNLEYTHTRNFLDNCCVEFQERLNSNTNHSTDIVWSLLETNIKQYTKGNDLKKALGEYDAIRDDYSYSFEHYAPNEIIDNLFLGFISVKPRSPCKWGESIQGSDANVKAGVTTNDILS